MLNPQQQEVVKTTDGIVRVLAGAGTGKTHTLISRIAYLISEKNESPHKILAVTFSNKAAHDLNKKLKEQGLPGVHAMTFYVLAARLLRKIWNPNFIILNPAEREVILSDILTDEENENIEELWPAIEKIRITGQSSSNNRLNEIVANYETTLREKKMLDKTGLLTQLLYLWEEKPEKLFKCQRLYLYTMVDDYQDMNPLEITIMDKVSELHRNLCITGDPDQTICSWRGSHVENMTHFERIYPESTSISLIKNHRNPPVILKGAIRMINHNQRRLKKFLQTTLKKEEPITLWESDTSSQQLEMLFHLMEKIIGPTTSRLAHNEKFKKFGEVALLYRNQEQGKMLYDQLTKRGYPCQLSEAKNFWEQKEIADFLEAMHNFKNWMKADELAKSEQKFSQWVKEKVKNFIEAEKLSVAKTNRINQLINYATTYDHLPIEEALMQFFDETSTQQEVDNLIQGDKINLINLHAAKGLEFPVVMIFELEEGNFPHQELTNDHYWLAEERRLLYVGMTRAREALHLFRIKSKKDKPLEPSRFLKEIGSENWTLGKMPKVKIRKVKKPETKEAQMKLF